MAELILVVDDTELVRYSRTRMLRAAGFEVVEGTTGPEAMTLIEQLRPRLVVLDVQMPGFDGWEVCRRVKANPETASILVLQVSATFVSEEDTVRALEGGADACLTEPIEAPVLIATVRALLRARRAEDALRDALGREQAARLAAESANRTKDEFLATLSHELRSPLGAILTWVTLLRSGRLDEARVAHALAAVERNTRLQAKLIEDLLDVSRIISGKMRIEHAPMTLASVIHAAMDTIRAAADAKRLRLEAVIDPAVGPMLGDAARLQQVVSNLLSNAVKFSDAGGRIEVHLENAEGQPQIRVIDSGRGIEPAFLPHLFERFRQADSSSTRSEGGLGLGLAIVRHLTEMHGGTVEAESEGLGRGATFTVRLPLPAAPTELPASTSYSLIRDRSSMPADSLAGLRLLVIDDERDTREAVVAVLEECGATVTAVDSVRDAHTALAHEIPDIVISDIAMPHEDGYEFIRAVRANDKTSRLPALALTAYAGVEERRRALEAGYDGHLTKPVDARELVGIVGRLAKQPAAPPATEAQGP